MICLLLQRKDFTMCGRYYVDEESNQELLKIIRNLDKRLQTSGSKTQNTPYHIKTGEIYPSDIVPIISNGKNSPCYEAMSWGFTNPNYRSLIINARSESANQKPLFSKSLKEYRAVVPASGFFEWSHNEDKTKYYFTDPDDPIMYMAAIAKPDFNLSRFVILTTAANKSMEPIHNRMPVLLKKSEVSDYLMSEEYANEILRRTPYLLDYKPFKSYNEHTKSVNKYTQLRLPL
ncbi:MAG: SOS response-associated peptidase family protein [Clostridiales bacterium]|nr:SOS response-associated peptidase family protein [Clostridiales bacterium]